MESPFLISREGTLFLKETIMLRSLRDELLELALCLLCLAAIGSVYCAVHGGLQKGSHPGFSLNGR